MTEAAVLAVNAGSSSIKLALFAPGDTAQPSLDIRAERIGSAEASAKIAPREGESARIAFPGDEGRTHETVLARLLPEVEARAPGPVAAAGHRLVHGGADFTAPVRVDDDVMAALERLVPLARTHQPHNLAAIRAVTAIWPDLPQAACFDTAFHATIPEVARTLALPKWLRDAGLRRYGFHGLSYRWIADRLPDLLGETAERHVIVLHLGNGASLCGMVGRRSTATTMGFTPLDGLVMGERPGLTDPGAILFMLDELGMSTHELRETLFKESGLLGLSGFSNDMRTLLASDEPGAKLAIAVYVHRAVREIGAVAAELGGLDALVFTGGIGENAAPVRAAIVERLGWFGARLDAEANARNARRVSPGGALPILVIRANEEAVIAQETRALIA
ncbi:MAG TPA: acetate/propionate family kinase [Thermohalobaculum sp.]|nr:acetate/propionate family kinase [Thermohalobaculum sp.]